MSDRVALKRTATAGRLAIAGFAAALLAGCSSDAMRIESFSNPLAGLSNPFSSEDKTGSIDTPAPRVARPAPVAASTLAAPAVSATSMAKYQQPVGGPTSGWSTAGGSAVVVAAGESLTTLSQRYGVPEQAILKANGFASASQLTPGTRLTIPVYNAAAAASTARVASAVDGTRAAQSRLEDERARLAAARKEAEQARAELEAEKRKASAAASRPQVSSLAAQIRDAKAEKARAEAERAELKAKQDRLARLKADELATQKKAAAAKADVKKLTRVEAKVRDEEKKDEKLAATRDKKKSAETKVLDGKADAAKKEAELKAEKAKKLAEQKAAEQRKSAKKTEAETTKIARVESKPEPVKPEPAKPEPTTTASVKSDEKPTGAGNPEFRWPARGRVIQGFRSNGNDGINIALPEGTAVKAAESGVVAYAGSELKNLGNLVLIRHPNGYVSAYAHNGELDVKRGDTVKRGQTIAKSGQSGSVQSPQLHFELRKGSTPVDPTQYLAGL